MKTPTAVSIALCDLYVCVGPPSVQVETSVNALVTSGDAQLPVIEADKAKSKKGYTNSGHLIAGGAHIEHHPTLTQVRTVIIRIPP